MARTTDEISPDHCPNGHRMDPDEPVRGWTPCWCSRSGSGRHGHRRYRCPTCAVVVQVPGHVVDPTGSSQAAHGKALRPQ